MQVTRPEENELSRRVLEVLKSNKDKRVIVVGTTCTGKSTLLQSIKKEIGGAQDMDLLVFPKLTQAQAAYVCSTPWTEEIGSTMTRLVREKVTVMPGHPVFGTVVLDCDLIVHLKISDRLLQERTTARDVSYADAKRMQLYIKNQIKRSGARSIDIFEG